MLFLVTGASCVGKTTIRPRVLELLGSDWEGVELKDLGEVPPVPGVAWRHEMAERALRRALELQPRHLLLAGDPVPAAELAAAPSGCELPIFVCLLDVGRDRHIERLRKRHEPESLIPNHLAWADWLRQHATNPVHVLEAITTDAWAEMNWDRLATARDWTVTVIDTSEKTPEHTAHEVAGWATAAREGRIPPLFRLS